MTTRWAVKADGTPRDPGDDAFSADHLRNALTGPYALSLRLFPVMAALYFLPAVAVESKSINSRADLLGWLVVEALGVVALGLTYLAAKGIVRGLGIRLRFWWVLLVISGIGGVVQSLAIAGLLTLGGPDDLVGPVSRAVSGFVITILWLPAEAVVLSVFAWGRELQRRALQEAVTLERTRLAQSQLAVVTRRSIEAGLAEEVRDTIDGARSRFSDAVQEVKPTEAVQALLRDVATSEIRPLATELWGEAEIPDLMESAQRSITDWPRLMHANTDRKPFYPALFTFIVATVIAPIMIRNNGEARGLPLILPFLATLFAIQWAGAAALRRQPSRRDAIVISTVVLSAIVLPVAGIVAHPFVSAGLWQTNIDLAPIIVASVTVIITQAVIAFSSAALFSREMAFEVFQGQVDKEVIHQHFVNAEIARESRRWATYLHGQVQSRFLAAAALLESAAESPDPADMERALVRATEVLDDMSMTQEVRRRDLTEELEYRARLWAGLVRVTMALPDAPPLPASLSLEAVGEVAEEGISNAVRHGRARNIDIACTELPAGGLRMVITDDGMGPQGSRVGLGSTFLTATSGGDWSLARDEERSRTVLTVCLV